MAHHYFGKGVVVSYNNVLYFLGMWFQPFPSDGVSKIWFSSSNSEVVLFKRCLEATLQ